MLEGNTTRAQLSSARSRPRTPRGGGGGGEWWAVIALSGGEREGGGGVKVIPHPHPPACRSEGRGVEWGGVALAMGPAAQSVNCPLAATTTYKSHGVKIVGRTPAGSQWGETSQHSPA